MIEIFQNIRQLYTFAPPRKELLPYIEFFSETNLEETKAIRKHFRPWHLDITTSAISGKT